MIKKANQILNRPFKSKLLSVLLHVIAVGLVIGLIVSVFRWIIDQTMQILYFIYPQMAHNTLLIIPYVLFIIIISLILGKIIGPFIGN